MLREIVAVWLVLLVALPLHAQDAAPTSLDAEARANFEAGRVAFADARFGDALPYFERAYELSHRPQLLYNLGVCHDRLGHDAEALEAFERYLVEVPDAENRAEVEQRIVVARERAARRAAGQSVESEPRTDPGPPPPDATPGWVLFGSGLAVLAAGGVLVGIGAAERSSVESSFGTLTWVDASARLGTADALTISGAVALGVGAILGSVGVALALDTSSGRERLALELGPTHARLSW